MRGRVREGAFSARTVDPHWARDVLQRLFAHILERKVEAARRILLNTRRYTDAARLGQAFEAGRDIDAIAEDVALFDDDIALVDADAELDAAVRRQRGVVFG